MREYHQRHRQIRGDVAKTLNQVMREKRVSNQDIAAKVYRTMGYASAQSAAGQISAFKNGKASTFINRRRPVRNQSLSFNQRELDRLKVLFEVLKVSDEFPICERLRVEYPLRESPSKYYPSFDYNVKPQVYLDSLDSALL